MRRPLSVLVGVALAAVVVAAAPAHASPAASQFQISFLVTEGPDPAAGTVLTYDAGLESNGAPIAGVPVTLLARPYGGTTSFVAIAHGTTAADGSVEVRAGLRSTSVIEWTYAGDDQYAATTSPGYVQRIGTKVAAHVLDSTLSLRQPVVVVGRSGPLKPGGRVSLWRGDIPSTVPGQSATRIAVGRIRADGTFRLTARFAHPGAKRLYVKVSAGSGNSAGYSRYLHVQVR